MGGAQGDALEGRDGLRGVSPVADGAQPARLRRVHQHALGAEGRHDLVGHEIDDIARPHSLGERRRQMQYVVDLPGLYGDRLVLRGRRRRTVLPVRGEDPHAQAPAVRVQAEGQPPVRRPVRDEGHRPAADHRGAVAVLEDGVAQPRQDLPGTRSDQILLPRAEQLRRAGGDHRDAALQVQRAAAAGQPLDEIDRCPRLLRGHGAHRGRRQHPRRTGRSRAAVGQGAGAQDGRQAAAAVLHRLALGR